MYQSLARLEAIRGKAQRVTHSTLPPAARLRVAWACGCVASGPSYDRLELQDVGCRVHRTERLKTTLVLERSLFDGLEGPNPTA